MRSGHSYFDIIAHFCRSKRTVRNDFEHVFVDSKHALSVSAVDGNLNGYRSVHRTVVHFLSDLEVVGDEFDILLGHLDRLQNLVVCNRADLYVFKRHILRSAVNRTVNSVIFEDRRVVCTDDETGNHNVVSDFVAVGVNSHVCVECACVR